MRDITNQRYEDDVKQCIKSMTYNKRDFITPSLTLDLSPYTTYQFKSNFKGFQIYIVL